MLYVLRIIGASFIIMSLFSCSGTQPANLGIKDGRLSPCPSTPNCVSSDAADSAHGIEPFQLVAPPRDAWRTLRAALAGLPRTEIVSESDGYLHAECRSAFFGFVDDLEFHLRSGQNLIAVRSASRLGHSDLGVNRKRVEKLRAVLLTQGIIR